MTPRSTSRRAQDNRQLEIGFDRYQGADLHARQEAMISSLWGWSEKIKSVFDSIKRTIDKAKNMGKAAIQAAKDACGAIVVTRHGCANFMPTLDEVSAFVAGQGEAPL